MRINRLSFPPDRISRCGKYNSPKIKRQNCFVSLFSHFMLRLCLRGPAWPFFMRCRSCHRCRCKPICPFWEPFRRNISENHPLPLLCRLPPPPEDIMHCKRCLSKWRLNVAIVLSLQRRTSRLCAPTLCLNYGKELVFFQFNCRWYNKRKHLTFAWSRHSNCRVQGGVFKLENSENFMTSVLREEVSSWWGNDCGAGFMGPAVAWF